MNNVNKIIVLIVAVFVSTVAIAGVQIGEAPPSFLGKNRQGEKVELDKMKGKVVVVMFWETKCSSCLQALDMLERVQKQAGKDKIAIVAVNFKEDKKTFSRIKKKLRNFEMTLTHDKRGRIGRKYAIKKVPQLFVINKLGLLMYIHQGYSQYMMPRLVSQINQLVLFEH